MNTRLTRKSGVCATLVAVALLSGCTVSHGVVKDVHSDGQGNLVVHKCDIKAYLAFYGLIAADENCTVEKRAAIPSGQASLGQTQ